MALVLLPGLRRQARPTTPSRVDALHADGRQCPASGTPRSAPAPPFCGGGRPADALQDREPQLGFERVRGHRPPRRRPRTRWRPFTGRAAARRATSWTKFDGTSRPSSRRACAPSWSSTSCPRIWPKRRTPRLAQEPRRVPAEVHRGRGPALVDNYGADDVGRWYWEVWNRTPDSRISGTAPTRTRPPAPR